MKQLFTFALFLSLTLPSFATVRYYQPPSNYISSQGGYLFLDINNDGTDDFLLTASLGPDIFTIKGLSAGSKMLTDGAGLTRGLNDSIMIGSNFASNLWADSSVIYRWDGGIYPYPLFASVSIPVQILINGNVHYGYIYGPTGSMSGFTSFGINRLAYEDVAGAAIEAAAMTSTVGVLEEIQGQLSIIATPHAIQVDFGKNYNGDVTLLDMSGKQLFATAFKNDRLSIAADGISDGMYLLRISVATSQGTILVTRKFAYCR